ncbi:MAG: flagellar hook protein FlgE [Nitrosomonadales bacterium]|nr:MAG: flagellar hook protein FlgE [Nitrosomonadales bacterium]
MSFQQGLSGLNAASKNLDVIGNNVSNAQTAGFKEGQAQFADVFAASLAGSGTSPVGIGTKVAAVTQQFTQGNITSTNNPLDVAINGGGFFVVRKGGSESYTRNGQFQLDSNGYIVTNNGFRVAGYTASSTGGIIQNVTDVRIPKTPIAPQATGTASGVQANLNFDSSAIVPSTTPFDYTVPSSYTSTTATTIYDNTGAASAYSMYFRKTAPNTWGVYSVLTNSAGIATPLGNTSLTGTITKGGAYGGATLATLVTQLGTDAGTANVVGTFTLTGTANVKALGSQAAVPQAASVNTTELAHTVTITGGLVGSLVNSAYYPITNATVTIPAGGAGAPTQPAITLTGVNLRIDTNTGEMSIISQSGGPVPADTLTFSNAGLLSTGATYAESIPSTILSTSGSALSFNVNLAGSTQYAGSFGVNSLTQDGFGLGRPAGFNIGTDGIITGRYTNGQTLALGQLILRNFPNPQGLQPIGDNMWNETSTSGSPVPGTPGASGDFGLLQSSATEDSNVDLTAELVNMITAQRVYQANAQTIKTVDAVLQTLINLR